MTGEGGDDRRRDIEGRINTLGTGSNGVSGRRSTGSDDSSAGDEEFEADRSSSDEDETETERETGVTPEADTDGHSSDDDDEDRETGVTPEADTEDHDGEEEDDRDALDVEMDRFVRAFAQRRADSQDETVDEYVIGSVKGYLAGLLGGDVESPGTLKRQVEIEADEVFGGLLEAVAEEEQDRGDVVVEAVAEAHDVPEEDTLTVDGLRDHEAMLNGVVANNSNSLGDVSEVVQAAVETRLIEERAD
jgi:hypothetical protein